MTRMTWKGPSVLEIATVAGVSTATVDRVLNSRKGIREATRLRVEAAISKLKGEAERNYPENPQYKIAFICEAGSSFVGLIESQARKFFNNQSEYNFVFETLPSVQVDTDRFSKMITRRAKECDGMIIVARDNIQVTRAIREASESGVHVVCLTTDLPSSKRIAYVGVDQVSTGATAGWMMGRMLPEQEGEILLLYNSTYRTQVEREVGFRRVLQDEFSHLKIIEKLSTRDEPESSYASMMKFLKTTHSLAGIYNMAGGNRGIAQALRESGMSKNVIFIGHELSDHTRNLLESGEMDVVLAHDIEREIELAVRLISRVLNGEHVSDHFTSLLVYNKHSSFI